MSNPVIKVESISKRYRIGLKEKRHDTLMGQIGHVLRSPLENLRRLRSLTRFDDDDESVFWALRDINFEVQEGEVLGIIGHNGAGKSTLLKILSRITEPTSGEIRIRGRISALLEVGTGFHPDLTGRENIYMNGTILGMTRREIDRKLDEIIDFSGVEKYIDTPVKRYSSGMTVRLAFSVAAHLEPEILIIDEVLAVGDAEFQKKCLGKMESVAGEGRTVLFVSHNMPVIQTLCKRTILLKQGTLNHQGSTNEVISKYLKSHQENKNNRKWILEETKAGCYFKEIEIQPLNGTNFIMGEDLVIKSTIVSSFEMRQFQIGIKIFDENYNLITWLFNTDFHINYDLKIGINYFFQIIKPYNLLPGIYYFTFYATYNYGHQNYDTVDEAIKIEVEPKDITGSGRPFLKNRGMVWFPIEKI